MEEPKVRPKIKVEPGRHVLQISRGMIDVYRQMANSALGGVMLARRVV